MKARTASLAIALVVFAFLAATAVVIFRGMHERDILENRNALERVLSVLFASLRDHDDFGSAIGSSDRLKKQVAGLGVYGQDGALIYSWGKVPETWTKSQAEPLTDRDPMSRNYIGNPKNSSFILLIHPFRFVPPPPRGAGKVEDRPTRPQAIEPRSDHPFLFDTLKDAEVVYLEIKTPDFWQAERFRQLLFPLCLAVIAALVLFVRGLILRNAEYRQRIEEQRNLVVLGTAAATLAHEIKNPLLSIRLQSSILERTCPEGAKRELKVINAEIDRLSALAYRVNDYLREPKGAPSRVDVASAAREVSERLAGRDLVAFEPGGEGRSFEIEMDADRLRSILENTVGNAIEAGGPHEGLGIELGRADGKVEIRVMDRGPGVPKADRERVFDPFFTTKSRGTGIGLAISLRFARAAGGEIRIEERPGGGCLARLSFPAAAGMEES